MSVIADMAVAIVFLLCVYRNFKDGFISSFLRLIRFVLSMILAIVIGREVVSFFAVFIAVYLIITVLMIIFKKIKLPVITGFCNKVLGLVLGVVLGLFYATLISLLVMSVCGFLYKVSGNSAFSAVYEESVIIDFILNLKFLDRVIEIVSSSAFLIV